MGSFSNRRVVTGVVLVNHLCRLGIINVQFSPLTILKLTRFISGERVYMWTTRFCRDVRSRSYGGEGPRAYFY